MSAEDQYRRALRIVARCHEAIGEDPGSDSDSLPETIAQIIADYRGRAETDYRAVRAMEELRQQEWITDSEPRHDDGCPACHGTRSQGHNDWCVVATALRIYDGENGRMHDANRARRMLHLLMTIYCHNQSADVWREDAMAALGRIVHELDEHGQPICEKCGKKTNAHYAHNPWIPCWNCGGLLKVAAYGGGGRR